MGVRFEVLTAVNNEDHCVLQCEAMHFGRKVPAVRRDMLFSSSGHYISSSFHRAAYFSTLRMNITGSSETSGLLYQTTQQHIQEDSDSYNEYGLAQQLYETAAREISFISAILMR
jgi:hypothetical protein